MIDVETASTPSPETVALARGSLAQCEAFRPSSPKDIRARLLNIAQLQQYLTQHG
jgi:hypothetical protein